MQTPWMADSPGHVNQWCMLGSQSPPPVDEGMTHACENITLSQIPSRAVINYITGSPRASSHCEQNVLFMRRVPLHDIDIRGQKRINPCDINRWQPSFWHYNIVPLSVYLKEKSPKSIFMSHQNVFFWFALLQTVTMNGKDRVIISQKYGKSKVKYSYTTVQQLFLSD